MREIYPDYVHLHSSTNQDGYLLFRSFNSGHVRNIHPCYLQYRAPNGGLNKQKREIKDNKKKRK